MRLLNKRLLATAALGTALIGLAGCAVYPAPGPYYAQPYYYDAPQPYYVYHPYRPYHHDDDGRYGGHHYWH